MGSLESEALQTLMDSYESIKNKDHARLLSLHLGEEYTLFNDGPPQNLLEDDTGLRLKLSLLNQLQDVSYQIRGLHLKVYGEAAVAAYELEMSGILVYQYRFEGQRWVRRARCTTVMILREGSWKIVHEHFSPMETSLSTTL
ncbi:MAG: nuclear transport factor 2 family protein [Nitrososphaerota archaeon]|nr:nuclear transport factor 2 family protein [Candidatus Calditenuaceae archaeon]MDW8073655.1 nuclear transport factor 2 family protein [Nitrososphaerota archaeon]